MSTNFICICIYSPVSPSPHSWELYACIIFNTGRQTVLGTKPFVSERSCVVVAHKSWHTSSRQGGMETSLCLLTVWYCQLCYHGTSHSVCHHFSNHRFSLHSSRTIKKEKGMIVKWRIHILFSIYSFAPQWSLSGTTGTIFFSFKKSKSQFTSADVSADFPPRISLAKLKKEHVLSCKLLCKKTSFQSVIFYIVSHANNVFFLLMLCWILSHLWNIEGRKGCYLTLL